MELRVKKEATGVGSPDSLWLKAVVEIYTEDNEEDGHICKIKRYFVVTSFASSSAVTVKTSWVGNVSVTKTGTYAISEYQDDELIEYGETVTANVRAQFTYSGVTLTSTTSASYKVPDERNVYVKDGYNKKAQLYIKAGGYYRKGTVYVKDGYYKK